MRLGSVLVAAVISCYFLFDMIRDIGSPREVSLYAVDCKGKSVGNISDGKLGVPLGRVTFVAFPDRQEVVMNSGGTVERLDGCVVQDWRTWTCTAQYPDGSAMVWAMNEGALAQTNVPHGSDDQIPVPVYLPAWAYYWHRYTWNIERSHANTTLP